MLLGLLVLIPACGESTDPNRDPLLDGIVAVEALDTTGIGENGIEKVEDRIVRIRYSTGGCGPDAVPAYPQSVRADYAPELIVVRLDTTVTCRGGSIDDIAFSREMHAELTEPIGDRRLALRVAGE